VVARNPAIIFTNFGFAEALGAWEGKLRNGGESVVLRDSNGDKGTPGVFQVNSYEAWKTANGVADDEGDQDGDGVVKLLEFFLFSDPLSYSAAVLPDGVVEPFEVSTATDDYLSIKFRRRVDTAGMTYLVRCSNDLEGWGDAAVLHSTAIHGDGSLTEVWRSAQPVSMNDQYFINLQVLEDE